jgi:hypothetical protein
MNVGTRPYLVDTQPMLRIRPGWFWEFDEPITMSYTMGGFVYEYELAPGRMPAYEIQAIDGSDSWQWLRPALRSGVVMLVCEEMS